MHTNFHVDSMGGFRRRLYKRFTLALFFILPSRLTRVFVSLSIISLIFTLRDSQLSDDSRTVERVGKMLNLHLSESVLMLPQHTCHWYWSQDVIDSRIPMQDGSLSLREMVSNTEQFMKHRQTVLTYLLDALPRSIAVKLELDKPESRLHLKHNITSALMYA